MRSLLTRTGFLLLLGLFSLLQFRLWVGDGSLAEVWQLKRDVAEQQQENRGLKQRNRRLAAEVLDLKEGLEVIEDRARSELGMIRADETFYQLVEE